MLVTRVKFVDFRELQR